MSRNSVASLALIASLLPLLSKCQSGDPCPSIVDEPSCVCNHPDGSGRIDATILGNLAADAPKFQDIVDPEGYAYTLNACHQYSEKLCTNVHICQTSNFNPDITYAIASGGTEAMYIDPDGVPYIYYTGPGGRTVYVYLYCTGDSPPKIETDGDQPVFFEYIFRVYSKDVCPGGNSPNLVEAGAIGISIMVLLIVGITSYFIIGMIVMKVHYNAAGVDIIPNKTFWKNLPGLIRDGCMFVVSPCTGLALAKKDGYSEMKS